MSHICTINIFHICTFSYIVEDYFLGLNLKFDSVRLNFPKFNQKLQRKAEEKRAEELRLQGVELLKVEK